MYISYKRRQKSTQKAESKLTPSEREINKNKETPSSTNNNNNELILSSRSLVSLSLV